MHRLLLLLLALVPASLAAQSQTSFGVFVARNGSLPTEPNLMGFEMASGARPVMLRFSAGAGPVFSAMFGERGVDRDRLYGAMDLDLQVDFTPWSSIAVAPFIGIGAAGVRDSVSSDALAMWSWGGTVRVPFGSGMAVNLEARERIPFSEEARALDHGFRRAWEQRLSISFPIGGRSHARNAPVSRTTSTSRSGPTGKSSAGSSHSSAAARRLRLVDGAEAHIGTRYRYGGDSPREGFDCSGFVRYVFAREGITLPRTAGEQATRGERISHSRHRLVPGDLLFFRLESSRIDHVAIYAGDGRIIHSTSSGGGVRYDDLDSRRGRWYLGRLVSVRRVVD